MMVFSIIMIVVAIIFLLLGISIYKGNTQLIHEYHQNRVSDEERAQYGRDFSAGMFTIFAALLIGGVLALFEETACLIAALAVIFAGLITAVIIIACVQKKYNGGIF